MSAARLREAATLLRERAEAATPGPWDAHPATNGMPSDGPMMMRVDARDEPGRPIVADFDYDQRGGADALYVATMAPTLALAFADLLDEHDETHSSYDCNFEPCAALTVADAILGDRA